MKAASVLFVQTPLLKTVLTTKTPAQAAELLNAGIRWHDDLTPVLDYIRQVISEGKESFDFNLHLDLGTKWATDIQEVHQYSESEFDSAVSEAIKYSQEEELRDSLSKIANSETPLEDYQNSQVALATISKNPFKTYSTAQLSTLFTEQRELLKNAVGGLLGASTGFKRIDEATYGFQDGHFWILGGTTSGGKTWISLQMMLHAIRDGGLKGLYMSMELSATEVFARAVAHTGGFSLEDCKTKQSFQQRINETSQELTKDNSFFVNDSITNIDQAVSVINEYATVHGVKFFIVDYLQNFQDPKKSEYEVLNQACLALQTLARTKKICILAVTQFNRESVKARKKDKKSLFQSKGSGNIENSADYFLQLEDCEGDELGVEMRLIKNRPFGKKTDTTLQMDLEKARYKEFGEDVPSQLVENVKASLF